MEKKASSRQIVSQSEAPIALSSLHKKIQSIDEIHEKNLKDGFIYFPISRSTTGEIDKACVSKIKKMDENSNKIDKKTGRMLPNQKPYFKYTSIQPDGSEKAHGGGWYLYSGWNDQTPVYFRAKSAVRNSTVPNFSIQWNNVNRFYYKFHSDSHVIKDGDKEIVIRGKI